MGGLGRSRPGLKLMRRFVFQRVDRPGCGLFYRGPPGLYPTPVFDDSGASRGLEPGVAGVRRTEVTPGSFFFNPG